MTYRELAKLINSLTPEQQDCNVTILDRDTEFLPIEEVRISRSDDEDGDVLDPGHPYLVLL